MEAFWGRLMSTNRSVRSEAGKNWRGTRSMAQSEAAKAATVTAMVSQRSPSLKWDVVLLCPKGIHQGIKPWSRQIKGPDCFSQRMRSRLGADGLAGINLVQRVAPPLQANSGQHGL
jgi:hypothetical protein